MVVLTALLHPLHGLDQDFHLPALSHHLYFCMGPPSLLRHSHFCRDNQPLGPFHDVYLLHPTTSSLGSIHRAYVLPGRQDMVGKYIVRLSFSHKKALSPKTPLTHWSYQYHHHNRRVDIHPSDPNRYAS